MKYIKTIAVVLLILVLLFVIGSQSTKTVVGGFSDDCTYKHVTSANASGFVPVQVKGGAGILCNVVLASSSPAVALGVRIYDGTTATSSGTLISKVKSNSSEQAFEYNVSVVKGIVLDVPVGFDGSLMVGFR